MIPRACFLLSLFLWAGCASTPSPSGRTLVSVSFVNTGPSAYGPLRLDFEKDRAPLRMESVPGYAEQATAYTLPLRNRQRVRMEFLAPDESVEKATFWVERPSRRDLREEYNLRIHLGNGTLQRVELEPAGQMRARLSASGQETP